MQTQTKTIQPREPWSDPVGVVAYENGAMAIGYPDAGDHLGADQIILDEMQARELVVTMIGYLPDNAAQRFTDAPLPERSALPGIFMLVVFGLTIGIVFF